MKSNSVLEPINDMQEFFDVAGYTLEQQGYSISRIDNTLKAETGPLFLKRRIEVCWKPSGIELTTKGSKIILQHDIDILTKTLASLRAALCSGNFTDGHRMFKFSNKHY